MNQEPTAPGPRSYHAYIIVAMVAIIAVLIAVVFILADRGNSSRIEPFPRPEDSSVVSAPHDNDSEEKAPLDPDQFRQEFEGPDATPVVTTGQAVLHVNRVALNHDKGEIVFSSLAAACAAAAPGASTVIQIDDNGPIFATPIHLAGRDLVIRAGPGYRPMLVWDIERWRSASEGFTSAGKNVPFIFMDKGNLTLENLDLALDWPKTAKYGAAFVAIKDGDFVARDCTFSAAGHHAAGVPMVHLEGSEAGKRAYFKNCFGRGNNLIGAQLDAPGALLTIDQCLFAGGRLPLIISRSSTTGTAMSTVRMLRSTLVGTQCIVRAEGTLRWLGWDSLLIRAGKEPAGSLVKLAGNGNLHWRGINSLYAGWKTLLDGQSPINNVAIWRKHWPDSELEKFLEQGWGKLDGLELAEVPPLIFARQGTPFVMKATSRSGRAGCNFREFPYVRTRWIDLAYKPTSVAQVPISVEGAPPAIPDGKDGRYYGGRIDLTKTDLADYLAAVKKKQSFGRFVVLHLSGHGRCKFKPIALRQTNLTLYFEPASKGTEPLILVAEMPEHSNGKGLIELENGNLHMIGGDIRCQDARNSPVPPYLVHIKGGNLRLLGTRLEGPMTKPPATYQGLVYFEGSGLMNPNLVQTAAMKGADLLTARTAITVAGVGARLRLHKCRIISRDEGLYFKYRQDTPFKLNVQCILEQVVIAARRCAVLLDDAPGVPLVLDPIIVQSQGSVFLNPFLSADRKAPSPAAVLLFRGDAVPRGLLSWQGLGNVMDQRLFAFVEPARPGRHTPAHVRQSFASWKEVWGTFGTKGTNLNNLFKSRIELEHPRLEEMLGRVLQREWRATPRTVDNSVIGMRQD
jgi:hypothetical protein